MPRINFEEFEILWKTVERKFVEENSEEFSLDSLHKLLIAQGLITPLTNFKSIEEKFLKRPELSVKEGVNLPDSIFNALYKYLGIRGIFELKGQTSFNLADVRERIKEEAESTDKDRFYRRQSNLGEIGFLGREKELSELEDFLLSAECQIFALYGVPMIGKTRLVNHFLENSETATTYQVKKIKLNPKPDDAGQRIKDGLFGEKEYNDFSDFSANTIIVLQNFEETLKWTGNHRELHDIKDQYKNIKTFLEKATQKSTIKLILESRFQIHFEVFLADWRAKVKTLADVQLEGIERDKFWAFYESQGFSYEDFETLCENFNNHTGLLALAYNEVEWLYEKKLTKALDRPKKTTRLLWDFLEYIIDRLESRDVWLLCALTFLEKPVAPENIYPDFQTLPDFEDELQIDDSFESLTKKLLVQLDNGLYDLNPYIREVCYTFLSVRRRIQMQKIENLPYFKEHGKEPYYDDIQQAQERGNFLFLLKLGQKLRDEGRYNEAINVFEASFEINPKKEVVLTEIAITYKFQKDWKKAIEILEKAREKYPNDVKILNELAICYRENNQFDKAIETLEKAREKYPNDFKILDELAICYRKNNQLERAIIVLEKAKEINPENIQTLNELGICYRENQQFGEAIKTLEKATELGNIHSYNELAICYRENNRFDKAIETLEKAREKYPDNVIIINELGICYREADRLDKAIETLEKAREKYPNEVKILSVLVEVYKKKDDFDKAYEIAWEGVKASNWKDALLVKQFRSLKKLIKNKNEEQEVIQTETSIALPKVMEKNVILFLSANPEGSTLRLDTEMREVENQLLRVAKDRDNFKLTKEVATRIIDLQQRLLDETPSFVHFSGHGSVSGIYLTDNQGNYQLVRGESLANLFRLFSDKIKCIFLNSCYSEAQANEINKFIPFVIGMKEAVPDDVAIQFAVSFYQAIASGRDVEFSFELAKNSVDLHNLSGSDIPVLLKR